MTSASDFTRAVRDDKGNSGGPPSKDSPSMTPAELRSHMTRDIAAIAATQNGGVRATLDRYLSTFNKQDEGSLPVSLRPHHEDPLSSSAHRKDDVLYHMIGTMVVRYWAFVKSPSIQTQREWDAMARRVHKVATRGYDDYTVHGDDTKGYTLISRDMAERLDTKGAEQEAARRKGVDRIKKSKGE